MPTKVEYKSNFAAKLPIHHPRAQGGLTPTSSNLLVLFLAGARCPLPTFLGLRVPGSLFRLQLQTHHCDFLFNKHYPASSGKQ